MKRLLAIVLIAISFANSYAAEKIVVKAKAYEENTDRYVGDVDVSLRMLLTMEHPYMIFEVRPFPPGTQKQEPHLGLFFNQWDYSSTLQAIARNGHQAWIYSSKHSSKPESERVYLGVTQYSNHEHMISFFKMRNGEPYYCYGYYLKLTFDDEFELRQFFVEKGLEYNIFKQLPIIKE